jgi:multiple sugar transport system permease protein
MIKRLFTKKNLLPYWLILPTLMALIIFSLYPLLSGIYFSFTDIKYVGDKADWNGFQNYITIFQGRIGSARFFTQSFWQTIEWTVCVVGGQFIIGFATALLLNRDFFGKSIFNVLILIPWTIPSVVMCLTWQWMYDPFFGLINFYLQKWGIIQEYITWVGQPTSTIWPQVIVGIWRGIPFMALMLLSGLKAIDKELYEAARVDGANTIQQFLYITLPSMKTIITINLMLTTMWWWNSFDIQKIMSPVGSLGYKASTLPILAWFESFQWKHLGRGAAISIISLIVLSFIMVNRVKQEMKAVKE